MNAATFDKRFDQRHRWLGHPFSDWVGVAALIVFLFLAMVVNPIVGLWFLGAVAVCWIASSKTALKVCLIVAAVAIVAAIIGWTIYCWVDIFSSVSGGTAAIIFFLWLIWLQLLFKK